MKIKSTKKHDSVTISLIALGSNQATAISDKVRIVRCACELLSNESLTIESVSSLYSSPAFPLGPEFVNGAIKVRSKLSSIHLLEILHQVEDKLGRQRVQRWGQRVIDLDLLDHGGEIAPDMSVYCQWRDLPLKDQMTKAPQQIILPHPRIENRAFVLVPMQDIAPNWLHPVSGHNIDEMLSKLLPQDIDAIKRISE